MKHAAAAILDCPDVFHMSRQIERGSGNKLFVLTAPSNMDQNDEDDNGKAHINKEHNYIMIMHIMIP